VSGANDIPIRSIERGINALQAINRTGGMTVAEIARSAQLPYPTAARIVLTLAELGLIERTARRKVYRPTALTKTLSCGYHTHDQMVEIVRPLIAAFTKRTGWPSAFAVRVGGAMVMLTSTHGLTTQTFSDYGPGYSMPLTASALGLAYLAFADDEYRQIILRQIPKQHLGPECSDGALARIRENGYAIYLRNPYSKDPGKSSSIGVPIHHRGRVIGAITLVYFASAMEPAVALERYLGPIRETQTQIDAALDGAEILI